MASTVLGWWLRAGAVALTVLFLTDIVIVHTAIAFVSRVRANLLRSAVLAIFSFFQIPLGFAVFHLCNADSFSHPLTWKSALYFSVVTATTLGYGDFYPKKDAGFAQGLVVVEALTSVGFLSILIARLIALATTPDERGGAGGVSMTSNNTFAC